MILVVGATGALGTEICRRLHQADWEVRALVRADADARAAAAGCDQLVYVSYSGKLDTDSPLTNAKRAVERHLQASRLRHTILRPGPFMEVWLGPPAGFDLAAGRARVLGSGREPVSWISLADVAAFAVASVSNAAAHDVTLELGGPAAHSPLDVVRIAEEIGV